MKRRDCPPRIIPTLWIVLLTIPFGTVGCESSVPQNPHTYRVYLASGSFELPLDYSVRTRRTDGITEFTLDPFAPIYDDAGGMGPTKFSNIYVGKGDVYTRVTTVAMRGILGEPKVKIVGAVETRTWPTAIPGLPREVRVTVIRYAGSEIVILSEVSRLALSISADLAGREVQSENVETADARSVRKASAADDVTRSVEAIFADAQLRPLFQNGELVGYVVGRKPTVAGVLAKADIREGDVIKAIERTSPDGHVTTFRAADTALLDELARDGPMTIVIRRSMGEEIALAVTE